MHALRKFARFDTLDSVGTDSNTLCIPATPLQRTAMLDFSLELKSGMIVETIWTDTETANGIV